MFSLRVCGGWTVWPWPRPDPAMAPPSGLGKSKGHCPAGVGSGLQPALWPGALGPRASHCPFWGTLLLRPRRRCLCPPQLRPSLLSLCPHPASRLPPTSWPALRTPPQSRHQPRLPIPLLTFGPLSPGLTGSWADVGGCLKLEVPRLLREMPQGGGLGTEGRRAQPEAVRRTAGGDVQA